MTARSAGIHRQLNLFISKPGGFETRPYICSEVSRGGKDTPGEPRLSRGIAAHVLAARLRRLPGAKLAIEDQQPCSVPARDLELAEQCA